MSNQRNIGYRGCAVTARWTEVAPPANWSELEPLQRAWYRRFTASFSVAADTVCDESWQQFPATEFDSAADAMENAMTKACQMIDAKLAEQWRNTSRSREGPVRE